MSATLSVDQLRERRRQKILARSQASSRIVRHNGSDEDSVSCNHDDDAATMTETCCSQQFVSCDADVNGDAVIGADHPVHLPPTAAAASLANDFERVGGPAECLTHACSTHDHQHLSSNAHSKLDKDNHADTMKSWQRTRSLIMLVLGFVVRMCFSSVFLSPVIQTVFYPFMAAEIALFGYERSCGMEWKEDTSTSSSGSLLVKMWLVVFQLCGLNPDVRQTYSRLLTLLAVVCDDFAVFFFTFILTHVLFTSL